MPKLSWNEIQARAIKFSKNYENIQSEKAESQSFYNDFFQISKMMDRLHKVYSYSFDDRYEMYLSHLKGLSSIISLNKPVLRYIFLSF